MRNPIVLSLQNLLHKAGLEIRRYDPFRLPIDFDKEAVSLMSRVREFTMTSPERLFALRESVTYIVKNKIPGDIVECGVWRGGSSMACAFTLLEMGETMRTLYLYDTYEGMSEPTDQDVGSFNHESARVIWGHMQTESHNEWCYASLDEVKQNLLSTGYPSANISFVKGKVEDTLLATFPQQIALLRLDTDWYESTYRELQHLYPRLSKHGVLILDDYGHWQGARRAVDQYFEENNIRMLLCRVDNTGRVGIKLDE